jgi:virginiamycin A acetyltransferase
MIENFEKLTINNPTPETKINETPYVRLGPFSKLVNVETQGGLNLNDGATFNRTRVGKYTSLGCYSYVADTVVGRYCTFASRVSIAAFGHPTDWLSIHEFQYRDVAKFYGETIFETEVNQLQKGEKVTNIGSDVWIGDNAVVGRGLNIGHGSIIGMGAVVVKDVEPYSIVIGNPGRTLRKRFNDRIISDLLNLQWWHLNITELKGIDFTNIRNAISEIRHRMDEKG